MEEGRRCFGVQTVKRGRSACVHIDDHLQSLGGFLFFLFAGNGMGCVMLSDIGMHH